MTKGILVCSFLLGTYIQNASGHRALIGLEESGADEFDLDLQGSKCTKEQKMQFIDRFQIGRRHGKACSDENDWGGSMAYERSNSTDKIALYFYPKDDHNGAFGLCDEGRFNLGICHRIFSQSEHYSVRFYRVGCVEEATAIVEALADGIKIKHLVLGGHGDPKSLGWGSSSYSIGHGSCSADLEVEDDATTEFLNAVYPKLITGEGSHSSTVFLDACLNGKVTEEKNMVQFVAHKLAGTKVFASKISWDNDEFEVSTAKDFSGKIISEKTNKDRMRMESYGTGALRNWGFFPNEFCDDKNVEPEYGVREIQGCRKACEDSEDCKAFTWYPNGNNNPVKKCYLSRECEETTTSSKGALTFDKPYDYD